MDVLKPVSKSFAQEPSQLQHWALNIIDSLPDPTFVINLKGEVVAWNREMEKLTGKPALEMLGKGNYEYAIPFYGFRRPMLIDLVLKPEPEWQGKYLTIHREGDLITGTTGVQFVKDHGMFLMGKASLLRDNEGNVIGAIESIRDITEQKLAEELLRDSEERFRFLAENTGDVLYRLRYESMTYDYLSPAIEKLTGYSPEEINRKGFAGLIRRIEVEGDENDMSPEELAKRRVSKRVGEYKADYLIESKAGEMRWLRDHSFPWRDDSGELIGSVGILSDVSERRRTEDALKESERKFRVLAEHAPIGISLTGKDGSIEYINPMFSEITGYRPSELNHIWEWVNKACLYPYSRETINSLWGWNMQATEAAGEDREATVRIRAKDGSEKEVYIKSVFMKDGRTLATYQDVTEQRKLESRLRRAQKMEAIGTLAGGIAHDFNNVLAAIMGCAEISLSGCTSGGAVERNLKNILQAANRAKDLIKQILFFTREVERARTHVQLQPLIKEIVKMLRASIPKSIEIRHRIQMKSPAVVMADPTQIHQVLINLCTNAAHAMREKGGVLELSLTEISEEAKPRALLAELGEGRYVRLSVSDTGCGIAPEIMDRIFDPFFTTKGREEGTGMGLAVVHGIVKNHGGAIWVESELGKGSHFHVFLPYQDQKQSEPVRSKSELPRGSGCVLLVDDEAILIDVGREMLGELGYEVIATSSSSEALRIFQESPERFDLLCTDYTMPGMNGADLAREVMSIRPDMPVILCTGYNNMINEEQALAMGIRAFIMKPFKQRDIAEAIAGILQKDKIP